MAHPSNGAPSTRRRRTVPATRRRTTGGVALAAMPRPKRLEKKSRSTGRVEAKLRAVAHSTSPLTRSGWRRHNSWATGPPME